MWRGLTKRLFSTNYKNIIVSFNEKVGFIQLNRPSALNSLNSELMNELGHALKDMENNNAISCAVISGNLKSFAGNSKNQYFQKTNCLAGADIEEMSNLDFSDCLLSNYLANWNEISKFRKPLIAAINGYAVYLEFFIIYN